MKFIYIKNISYIHYTSNDLVVNIPINVTTKEQLLTHIRFQMNFPDYFGMNWDALHDCLSDLSWLSERNIIFVHESIPQLITSDLKIYLHILIDIIEFWEGDLSYNFQVVFLEDNRHDIENLIN